MIVTDCVQYYASVVCDSRFYLGNIRSSRDSIIPVIPNKEVAAPGGLLKSSYMVHFCFFNLLAILSV